MTGSETLLGTTITTSAVSVFIINTLKNASWFPLLQKESKATARVWALIVSGAAAAGIDVQFLHGTLTITGLTLTGILGGLWLWLKSFAVQEWIYQSTKQQSKANIGSAGAYSSMVDAAEPAPKPMPAPKKPSDTVTRSDVDEFVRKVRGPARLAFRALLRRELALGIVLLGICFAWMGCAARIGTVTNLPAGVTSAQVVQWDAAVANLQKIATATSGARQAVIALNKSGAFPDGAAYATTLSDLGKIDQAQIAAANFLETVPDNWAAGTQQQVSAFVSAVQAALTDLTTNGTIGIKSASSQSSIIAFVQEISAAANLILSLVNPPATVTPPTQKPIGSGSSSARIRLDRGIWDESRARNLPGIFASRIPARSGADDTFSRTEGICICAACVNSSKFARVRKCAFPFVGSGMYAVSFS